MHTHARTRCTYYFSVIYYTLYYMRIHNIIMHTRGGTTTEKINLRAQRFTIYRASPVREIIFLKLSYNIYKHIYIHLKSSHYNLKVERRKKFASRYLIRIYINLYTIYISRGIKKKIELSSFSSYRSSS
jgi:hypothetical protein